MNEIPRGQHDDQEGKGNGDGQQKQPQNRRSSWRRGESEETARGGGLPERKGRQQRQEQSAKGVLEGGTP